MPTHPPAARTTAADRARTRPPAYHLYGERAQGRLALADRLHCESIAERSRLHGWEIRPHRHEALFQCLVIEQGRALATLEGREVALRGPALVTAPALSVHGFRFAPDIQGTVITASESHLVALLQPHVSGPVGMGLGVGPGMGVANLLDAALRLQACQLSLRGSGRAVALDVLAAAAALRDEAGGHAPWRGAALDAALLRLCVAVARASGLGVGVGAAPAGAPGGSGAGGGASAGVRAAAGSARALQHVQRLRALVEAQFRAQPTQAALAAQLGITPTQLNRVCHQVLGHAAQGVLHARVLLQAQRELSYSRLSIKQIAFELGFSDAAYFTRFFRRLAGQSPAQWRAAQHGR